MMMRNKQLSVLLIICLLFSPVGVFAGTNNQNYGQANNNSLQGILDTLKGIGDIVSSLIQKFSDMKDNWSVEYVAELFNKGAIAGYPDGTFKPNNSISRAEFTKIMVTSFGEDPGSYSAGHWATNYLNKAIEKGYIKKGEFDDLNKAITRAEMARMISRALKETPQNIDLLKNQLTDFGQISSEYKDHIAKVYAAGIITGYPDGSFGPEKTATRAEASTMLVRLLNPDKRKVPEIKKGDDTFIEPELEVFYFEGKWDYEHFAFILKNPRDYEDKAPHIFTTECTSHPNINLIYAKGVNGKFMDKKIDMVEHHKKISPKFEGGNGIYSLGMKNSWKPVNGSFDPKGGDKMQYKITVSNGKTTKEYIIDVKFNDRKFN